MNRRYLSELTGTFAIVFTPVAFSAMSHFPGAETSLLSGALAAGLTVVAMIYALGPISAAHFNPAVTLGFAVAGRFPWRYVLPYLMAQCLGALLAPIVAMALFGSGAWGLTVPSPKLHPLQAVGIEAMLTFFLMLVIISVATDRRVHSVIPGLSIGATVVFCILLGGAATGSSMNPVRSLGPALLAGGGALNSAWIYLIGPCLGSMAAARFYEILRVNRAYAQSAPGDLTPPTEA